MYENGKGVPQDYAQAMVWYKKAADQGNALAQVSMGTMYEESKGVPQDYVQAMMWYKKAADQGNALAQVSMAFMYAGSEGVPQDYVQAMEWYKKAAAQGDTTGQAGLGLMYESGQGVPIDYAQAMLWYQKAANQGDANAQYFIGRMYEKGEGVVKDIDQAIQWYKKAADQGNASAQAKIDQLANTPAANESIANTSPPEPDTSTLINKQITITLKDGTEKVGKLIRINSDSITLLTDDGGGKVPFDSMSDADKTTLGYMVASPSSTPQTPASSISTSVQPDAPPDGVISVGQPSFHETDRDTDYVHFGWKVVLTNNSDHDASNISVTLSYRDKNDIQIGHSLKNDNAVKKGESISVTDTDLMKLDLWKQVDHTVVTFEEFQ